MLLIYVIREKNSSHARALHAILRVLHLALYYVDCDRNLMKIVATISMEEYIYSVMCDYKCILFYRSKCVVYTIAKK